MTTIGDVLVRSWINNLSKTELEHCDAVVRKMSTKIAQVGSFLVSARNLLDHKMERMEEDYDRKSRLHIYRQRRFWKKSDISRLNNYPQLNKPARNRIDKIRKSKSLGRGKTIPYVRLAQRLATNWNFLIEMFDPDTLPHQRLKLLKKTKWFPRYVEATYRGEYQKLKRLGVQRCYQQSVSQQTEEAVAKIFRITVPHLKRLGWIVRRDAPDVSERCRPREIQEIETWLKSGRFQEYQ